MDIHRCRFVPYPPKSINALAFSYTNTNAKQKTSRDLRLAIGRENGDIEIWNPLGGHWFQEKILRGSRDRTIEQLAWTQDLIVDEDQKEQPMENGLTRLFSSGGSSSITEWDLSTGTQKRHAESNSGHIWCFAAQPQWRSNMKAQDMSKIAATPSQMLAAGCSDGSIILFSTADDDLQYVRVLTPPPAKKSKVISITWRDRNTVVAGYEDSIIRVIDVQSRNVLRQMSLGKTTDGSNTVVWTIKCLPDGTILSGDSSGELKVWDAKNYSLVQKLKTHDADILDIASSASGDMLYSVGVDRRTVNYRPVTGQAGSKKGRWQQVVHRRYHQHDVKALAAFESKDFSVLVSGGMDTVPVVLPLRNLDEEYHRSLTHLPQTPQMSCSPKSRLMLTWWQQDLYIWHLPRRALDIDNGAEVQSEHLNHKLLTRVQLKGDENITSAQISGDGTMIVAATAAGVKLFQVRKRSDNGETEIRTRPIELPNSIGAFGALLVGFSPDSKWLCAVRTSNIITMVKIVSAPTSKDKPSIFNKVIKLGRKIKAEDAKNLGSYNRSINVVAFSSDSRIIATGDLSGRIDVWILEGHEDVHSTLDQQRASSDTSSDSSDSDSDDETDSSIIHGQKWIQNPGDSKLPLLNSSILALAFKPQLHPVTQDAGLGLHPTRHTPHPISHEHPAADTKLIAITSNHEIIEFDVLSAKLSDWSRRNPSSCLPTQFAQIKDRVMGAFWDCTSDQERLWLYGPAWLVMLDMSRDLDVNDATNKIGKLGRYDVKAPPSSNPSDVPTSQAVIPGLRGKKRKRNTGAGDRMKDGEWQRIDQNPTHSNGIPTDTGLMSPISNREINDDENGDGDEDEDVTMEEDDSNSLALIRRKGLSPPQSQSQSQSQSNTKPNNTDNNSKHNTSSPSFFSTFRYRSIFGVAVLSPPPDLSIDSIDQQHATDTTKKGLEIVVVERPLYDVELVPRFDGGQDWAT